MNIDSTVRTGFLENGVKAALAPAKINLALHVTGRRPDGYHTLHTLCVFTRTGDRISVAASPDDRISVSGPFAAGLGEDRANLVVQARDRLRESLAGDDCPPVALHLEKNLPVASGIGGGSSDAAATLRLLSEHWNAGGVEPLLHDIGVGIGADVPMCLEAIPLLASGIGEVIEPIDAFPALWLVLVNPGVSVATPAVFASLASRDNPPLPPLPEQLSVDRLVAWLETTRNDLQASAEAVAPALAEAEDALRTSGALFARMSGSGATCFGLFADARAAEQAAGTIGREYPDWFAAAMETTPSRR